MGLFLAKLEKLVIDAYDTAERDSGQPSGSFTVAFNPESYKVTYANSFQTKQGINTVGSKLPYVKSLPQLIEFKLIFDSAFADKSLLTVAVDLPRTDRGNSPSAHELVQKFMDAVYIMKDATHEPSYLRLRWGDVSFDCRLMTAEVNYSMFDRSGIPIRAEVKVSFAGDLLDPVLKAKKSSPDVTHLVTVVAGDTLPSLSRRVYGDARYYPQIAETNGLDHFRDLKPGQQLYFPPLVD